MITARRYVYYLVNHGERQKLKDNDITSMDWNGLGVT
jgi:hypothetical protein